MVLLVGCDTPFLQPALLERVVQAGACREAAVPRLEGIPQTLQATYSRRCLSTIERLLAHGRPGLRDLLLLTDVAYLDTDEIIKTDPDLLSFFNVNSEADLERAKRLLEIGGGP
jgi:molybdopterin-guanine dinucleotide biosynthesis protein A